jgi:hypothetical protein
MLPRLSKDYLCYLIGQNHHLIISIHNTNESMYNNKAT